MSYHTVNRYVEILEQSFLVRTLRPYHANVGKRLVKSPKLYVRDSGLVHHFLGIHSLAELEVHPARGLTWETFVVDQILTILERELPGTEAFFWRTATGDEADLLLSVAGGLAPIEIKLHSSPKSDDAAPLRRCMDDLGIEHGWLVHAGSERYSLGAGVMAIPVTEALTSGAPWLAGPTTARRRAKRALAPMKGGRRTAGVRTRRRER